MNPMREKCGEHYCADHVGHDCENYDRLKELEAKLKDEAHDAHMWKHRAKEFERAKKVGAEYLSAKLAKAVEIIKKLIRPETEGVYDAKEIYEATQESKKFIEEIEGEK